MVALHSLLVVIEYVIYRAFVCQRLRDKLAAQSCFLCALFNDRPLSNALFTAMLGITERDIELFDSLVTLFTARQRQCAQRSPAIAILVIGFDAFLAVDNLKA